MNIRHNEGLRERLAAEYVLGTLRGGARRRLETWMRDDAALRRAVAEWQERLTPMAEFAAPAQPPARVWSAIQRRLGLDAAAAQPSAGWFDSIAFWRRLGIASTAAAAVMMAVLLVRQPEIAPAVPGYVAVLANDQSQVNLLVTGDTRTRQLTVRVITPQQIAADRSLELWALPKEGPPRSLGLVAANGAVTLPLPENVSPQSVPALAVSLEPQGGSPNKNAPTGPVLYKGSLLPLSS